MKILLKVPDIGIGISYQEVEFIKLINKDSQAVVRHANGFESYPDVSRLYQLPELEAITILKKECE